MRTATIAMVATGVALAAGCTHAAPEAAVRRLLEAQAAAWNQGDVDGYMSGYWRSPELTFSAGGETHEGWQATRDRYQARYPTPAEMGRLSFSELRMRRLGERAMLVLGRWRLVRDRDAPEGSFSLVVERLDGRWVVTHDHTSLKPSGGG